MAEHAAASSKQPAVQLNPASRRVRIHDRHTVQIRGDNVQLKDAWVCTQGSTSWWSGPRRLGLATRDRRARCSGGSPPLRSFRPSRCDHARSSALCACGTQAAVRFAVLVHTVKWQRHWQQQTTRHGLALHVKKITNYQHVAGAAKLQACRPSWTRTIALWRSS